MVRTDKTVLKKWMLWSGIVFAAVYSINCFLISPLTSSLLNDVVYADTALPTLLGYLNELLELGAISFFYAVMLMTLYRAQTKILPCFILFASATIYKYAANTAVAWILDGSIPSLLGWDIVNIFYYTLLELLQLFIIYLFARSIITKYTDKRLVMERALKKVGEDERSAVVTADDVYPFKKLFDMGNCLLRSAFVCAIVTLVAKLAGALISDIWLIIVYGAPQEGITWLYMALNYLSKIVLSVISYFAVFVSMTLLSKSIDKV